jgi:DNA-binding NtrC family response regulator
VIAASNRDLEELSRKGAFREDLYYRLNVIPIILPPLRARENDVKMLAEAFLQRFMPQDPAGGTPRFDGEALGMLKVYAWPGNVRELQNVVERAAALADGPVILARHLPEHIRLAGSESGRAPEASSYKEAKQETVRSFERTFLLELLKRHQWHMGNAAKEAGVDRKTIERMVKRHRLSEA